MARPRKHATNSDRYKAYRDNKKARVGEKIQIAQEAEALADAAKTVGIYAGPKLTTREILIYLREYLLATEPSVWRHEAELKK